MTPERLMALATGYWSSMTLLALNELGVFGELAAGPRTAADVAAALGTDRRATGLLMRAGVAHDLLTLEGDSFANTPESSAFLVPGGPAYLGGAFRYSYDVYAAWGGLVDAVRAGAPKLPEADYLGGDTERTERFVRAMHGRAMSWGTGIAGAVEVDGHRRLLDVAGGSGAFSILLCRRAQDLGATVCDLGPILAVSSGLIAEEGLSDRIQTHPWDLRGSDPLPRGHDVALVSGLLHRLTPDQSRDVLARVHDALEPGGTVFVADVMLDETGAGPRSATLFALNMLLTAPGGGAHRDVDHAAWLEAVGFEQAVVERLPPPAQHTVVRARKP